MAGLAGALLALLQLGLSDLSGPRSLLQEVEQRLAAAEARFAAGDSAGADAEYEAARSALMARRAELSLGYLQASANLYAGLVAVEDLRESLDLTSRLLQALAQLAEHYAAKGMSAESALLLYENLSQNVTVYSDLQLKAQMLPLMLQIPQDKREAYLEVVRTHLAATQQSMQASQKRYFELGSSMGGAFAAYRPQLDALTAQLPPDLRNYYQGLSTQYPLSAEPAAAASEAESQPRPPPER
ncbi:MAG TPA: hypothetical protein VGB99_18025 [Acidobacteriota bacterium]